MSDGNIVPLIAAPPVVVSDSFTFKVKKLHLALIILAVIIVVYLLYKYSTSNFVGEYFDAVEPPTYKSGYSPEELVVAWDDMGMINKSALYDPLEYVANHNRVKETPTEEYLWGVALAQPGNSIL